MDARPINHFLGFLAVEHENELVSVFKHGEDLRFLEHVDGLFYAPMPFLRINEKKEPLARLYSFAHYLLYATAANLLRMHVGEALSCERKAIDASLSAYVMLRDEKAVEEYLNRGWRFLHVKAHVEKARKNDSSAYPLATELLATWDMCSEFGAHADDSGFEHRTAVTHNRDGTNSLEFRFFQIPTNTDEAQLYFVDAFVSYLLMLRIFSPFVRECATDFGHDAWIREVEKYLDAAARKHAELTASLVDRKKREKSDSHLDIGSPDVS